MNASLPLNPSADAADGLPLPQRLLAVTAIISAIMLVVLDGAIANVALPAIATALQATPAASVWVVTAYQLAAVMFLLPASAMGERFGYRRMFAAGVALFTAGSAACALAPSLAWLVAARFAQGLGGAAVMPLGLALLRHIYPQRLLGRAIGWNALAVAAASAAGPAAGAALLSVAHWPWLFAVNLPFGLLALAACAGLPAGGGTARRIDGLSVALNAGMFAALVLGADRLPAQPLEGAALLAAAAACAVLLVRREAPRATPMVPLDLLRLRPFRLSIMASVCCFAGHMAGSIALPFYLQHQLGLGALTTGLLMALWPLAVMGAAPLSGRLAERVPTGWLCAAGALTLSAALALLAAGPQRLPPLAACMALAGLGFGFFQTPNNRNMLLAAPKARSGAAGGAQGSARLAGQTFGSLLMGLLFSLLPAAQALPIGLAAAAVLALSAALLSLARGA
ncbi:MFS transporter [Pelomonas sp. KK5]|uniref:MFS transporter n=1 Tax=Pelomonas sp. KK5 TaxID=1855730 RepID=UPI0009F93C4F|nr:MFS transporter [Pelomonas sp. KK5]